MFLIEMLPLGFPKDNYFSLANPLSYFSLNFATFSFILLSGIEAELDMILNADCR